MPDLQIWTMDEDRIPADDNYKDFEYQKHRYSSSGHDQCVRNDSNLCSPTKTVEMDTFRPQSYTTLVKTHRDFHVNSPKTPPSCRIKSIQAHSSSPRYKTGERNYYQLADQTPTTRTSHRTSMSEKSCYVPKPNYMAATESAMARFRSASTPRQMPFSPSRELASAKKRLSFPVFDS